MSEKLFVDTNVLVYLADTETAFHEKTQAAARELFSGHEPWISRQVLREYAVVVTRPQSIGRIARPDEVVLELVSFTR